MTLDDLELYKFEFSENFARGISQISDGPTAKRMKIDQYCQRQRCKHVELEQFFGMLSRRAGLSATAGLSCFINFSSFKPDTENNANFDAVSSKHDNFDAIQ